MNNDNTMKGWYNFVTGEYDMRHAPTTDEEARQYIHQDSRAQTIYEIRRKLGNSVLEAMLYALNVVIEARRPDEGQP